MANLISLIVWLLPVSSAKKEKENAESYHESQWVESLFGGQKMMLLVPLGDCCKTGRGFPLLCLSALCVIELEEKEIFFGGVRIFISDIFNSAFILKLPVEQRLMAAEMLCCRNPVFSVEVSHLRQV